MPLDNQDHSRQARFERGLRVGDLVLAKRTTGEGLAVALPLEAVNMASAREKFIRHGHPSTRHPWWSCRPLAACRPAGSVPSYWRFKACRSSSEPMSTVSCPSFHWERKCTLPPFDVASSASASSSSSVFSVPNASVV
jgi:hypothetical protein